MANLDQLVEDLSGLTVLEAAQLSKMLEEKWGVSAAAPVAVAAAGGGAAAAPAEAAEEQTEFDVIMTGFGAQKINVIKEVRAITGSASRRPRTWSRRCRRRSRRRCPRTMPPRSRRSSESPAPPWRSSRSRSTTAPLRLRACPVFRAAPAATAAAAGLPTIDPTRPDARRAARPFVVVSGPTSSGRACVAPDRGLTEAGQPCPILPRPRNGFARASAASPKSPRCRTSSRCSGSPTTRSCRCTRLAPERDLVGLEEVFRSVFPVRDFAERGARLRQVRARGAEVRRRGVPSARHDLWRAAAHRLIVWDVDEETGLEGVRDIELQDVYMGDMPPMMDNGTFVVNGTERVIVSQMQRPACSSTTTAVIRTARVFLHPPGSSRYRGSWLDFEFDAKDLAHVRIDRRRKLPVTTLLLALGSTRRRSSTPSTMRSSSPRRAGLADRVPPRPPARPEADRRSGRCRHRPDAGRGRHQDDPRLLKKIEEQGMQEVYHSARSWSAAT